MLTDGVTQRPRPLGGLECRVASVTSDGCISDVWYTVLCKRRFMGLGYLQNIPTQTLRKKWILRSYKLSRVPAMCYRTSGNSLSDMILHCDKLQVTVWILFYLFMPF